MSDYSYSCRLVAETVTQFDFMVFPGQVKVGDLSKKNVVSQNFAPCDIAFTI